MTITLYQNCKLTLDKNFAVDNIESYLATFSASETLVEINQNYFKQRLNTAILLELTQSSLNYSGKRFNYCKIQNGAEKAVYYFIINMEWRSQQVVYLTLLQDTISTLGILSMTNKTLIHRQHKDRYYIKSSTIYPIVDKVVEGISPTLKKSSEIEIKQKNNLKWYIAYIADNAIDPTEYNQVNPLKKYIFCEVGAGVRIGEDYTTTLSDYLDGAYYLFSTQTLKTNKISIDIDGGHYTLGKEGVNPNSTTYSFLVVHRVGTTLNYEIRLATVTYAGNINYGIYLAGTVSTSIKFKNTPYKLGFKASPTDFTTPFLDRSSSWDTSSNDYAFNGLRDLDLTAANLVKIIELPYPPLKCAHYNGDYYVFENNVMTVSILSKHFIALRYPELDKEYIEFDFHELGNYYNYSSAVMGINTATKARNQLKSKNFEPKLLNSEFYSPRFSYDSFSYAFDFENIDLENFNSNYLGFKMKPSENISSNFTFNFGDYVPLKESSEDYPNILNVIRNNEVTIFSSQYLNYLRNGYNYDVKAQSQQEVNRNISTGLSLAGGAVSIGLGVASMNPAVAVGGIIGGVTAITSSIVSNINQSILNTNTLEQKIAQLKNSKVNVLDANDLSLLKYYTKGNIAKFAQFVPSEVMQDNLLNLFHYTGYRCEYLGIPSLNSRNRFNFIQASIDIDESSSAWSNYNYPKEIIDDYKARFEVGLTIIHNYNSSYDFEQKYENWETILESYLT